MTAPTKEEFNDIVNWIASAEKVIPSGIFTTLKKIVAVYSSLNQGIKRAKGTLNALRTAMGILPKSEKGSQLLSQQLIFENLTSEQSTLHTDLKAKRDESVRNASDYTQRIREIEKNVKKPEQMEIDLTGESEMMFSFPNSDRVEKLSSKGVDRMKDFNKASGLQVSFDYPKRVDMTISVTEINYKVETVTDPETGKTVRASMIDEGPPGFQMTWRAISSLMKMHVGFAIPMNRIELMIGQPEFTTSKICRVLQYGAKGLLPVYLELAEQLAEVKIVSGDDTPTKVLNKADPFNEVTSAVDEFFGWQSPRADGRGEKTAMNVSLLMGRTEADPRSTIRFFRTHIGSVGNLLTKILETRLPQSGPLIFQGDLSSTNLPSEELIKKFSVLIAGCGAHARRPFWRYKEDDPSLCYKMLSGFLLLAKIEHKIDNMGRTRANVLKMRGRYSRMIWAAMRNRCVAAITGEVRSAATYPAHIRPDIWPPGTELYKACNYVIKNFGELTRYLQIPELGTTNNKSERGLRIEKSMLDASKFRQNRVGRVMIDILRTINATCAAAGIDPDIYLPIALRDLAAVRQNPTQFTPFAVAKRLEALRLEKPAQKPS